MTLEIFEEELLANLHPRYNEVMKEVHAQGENPPGKDQYIGNFYQALYSLSDDPEVQSVVNLALSERDLSSKHLVNLLFRGVQYIELNDLGNIEYPRHLVSQDDWVEEIKIILRDYKESYTEILLTKETGTTIYQRYAGPRIVLSAFLKDSPLKVVDFGAGGRYGLRGIACREAFGAIKDHTEGSIATQFLNAPVDIEEGLDIDQVDPDLPENIRWRMACSFYPSELISGKAAEVVDFENRIREVDTIKFFRRNIVDVTAEDLNSNTTPHSYDAVILSTVLYQIPEYQEQVIDRAKELVSDDGLIIVQDFAVKDENNPRRLNFDIDWFAQDFAYRTFVIGERTEWEFKEVLCWSNGRCKEVKEGEDLREALQTLIA